MLADPRALAAAQAAAEACRGLEAAALHRRRLEPNTAAEGEGLPPGWTCTLHSPPSGQQYKRYKGPNGERAQSRSQAWEHYQRTQVVEETEEVEDLSTTSQDVHLFFRFCS